MATGTYTLRKLPQTHMRAEFTVRVKLTRWQQLRLRLGVWLIMLAGWVLNSGIDFQFNEGDHHGEVSQEAGCD